MHGLTQLQHYIVGNVNYIANGAHAASAQTALHPFGGFRNFDILQNTGCKTRAQLRSINANTYIISSIATGSFLNIKGRHFQGAASNSADFASKSNNTEAVSTITSEVDIDNGVIEAQNLFYVHANGSVRRQNEDAITLLRQQYLSINAQLIGAAQHAKRIQATHFRFFQLQAFRVATAGRQHAAHNSHRNNVILMHILGTS